MSGKSPAAQRKRASPILQIFALKLCRIRIGGTMETNKPKGKTHAAKVSFTFNLCGFISSL
jgi:hypothetical protein